MNEPVSSGHLIMHFSLLVHLRQPRFQNIKSKSNGEYFQTLNKAIGYGNLTPSTQFGKIFCLVFILFGIPYFGYLMREMSQLINDLLCALRTRANKLIKQRFYSIAGNVFTSSKKEMKSRTFFSQLCLSLRFRRLT